MPAPVIGLPPWLQQSADPAANMAVGLQIGARLGAEAAANRYREMAMAREAQKDEFERQMMDAKQALLVDELTRKHRAQESFRSLIGQGVNPLEALMQVGPESGMEDAVQIAERSRVAEAEMAQNNQLFRPETMTVKDPVTGEPISVLRTGRNSWQRIAEPGQALTTTEKDYRAYLQAVEKGDARAQQVFGRKLGIEGLSPEDKLVLNAQIRSVVGVDPTVVGEKVRAIIEDFKSRKAKQSTGPATSQSTSKRLRWTREKGLQNMPH